MPALTKTPEIDPELAEDAIKKYNASKYGSRTSPDIDQEAVDTFAGGLGSTYHEILDQVEFIGWDYDGFNKRWRVHPDARVVARAIARDIFSNRDQYVQTATGAVPISQQIPSGDIIEILYRPFRQPLVLKKRMLKRWLINSRRKAPSAFSIEALHRRHVSPLPAPGVSETRRTYWRVCNVWSHGNTGRVSGKLARKSIFKVSRTKLKGSLVSRVSSSARWSM